MIRKLLIALGAFAIAAATAFAQPSAANEAELKAALEAAKKAQVPGPAEIPMRDQAALKLPKGYVWVPTPAAAQLMKAMGNRTGDDFVGAVFPEDDANWFAVVRFIKEGYIKDDDARDWNADELLKNLREGTDAANEERAKRGIPQIEVVGWAEKPRYDAATHRLVWSASSRPKGTSGTTGLGVNYNTYALGRDGYISLNLITDLDELDKFKPTAQDLLAALQYKEGKRYTDFNSSTDKVAAYGLAALVAGAAAKKLGLFALLFAFLAKFAKVIFVAGAAALWGVAKLFGRKKAEPVAASEHRRPISRPADVADAEAPTMPAPLEDRPRPPGAT